MRQPYSNEICKECGKRAYGGRIGSWFVTNEVWKSAGYAPTDVACQGCLAKRIRAKFGLKARDLTGVLVEMAKAKPKKRKAA